MTTGAIRSRLCGPVVTIVFDRPDKRNAFSRLMWEQLALELIAAARNDAIKVIILRGVDERAFAAGGDISEFVTTEAAQSYQELTSAVEKTLIEVPKPTIAMIQGACIGGGCLIATAADIRIAGETSTFAIPASALGIVYSLESARRLVDLVGPGMAKYMLFSGQRLTAREALEVGLVEKVVSDDNLESAVQEFACTISRRSDQSVQGMKRLFTLIARGQSTETPESIALNMEGYASADFRERVDAFVARRSRT